MKPYKIILLLFLLPLIGHSQNPFTPGNIVVYRIGDGNTVISGNAVKVFLDEYTSAGVLVQSIQMPAGATGTKLTGLRDDFEGALTLSTNGKFLMVPGYDIAEGASFPGSRSIAKVDFNGYVVSMTTDPNPNFLTMRSVASDDGNNMWIANGATIEYTSTGSSSPVTLSSPGSTNAVGIFGGQLYASTNSNSLPMISIGNGLPTTAGQTATALPGIPIRTRPQQFVFADMEATVPGMDVLYLTSQNPLSPGGLQKYSLVNGSWVFNGQVGATAEHYTGLAIQASGNNVTLFATRDGANAVSRGGELVTLTDNSGYNAALTGAPTVIASVATAETKAFRGIALVPQRAPFTAGNIVVYRIGDGNSALSGNAAKVFLDEYTPAGTLVQSIGMPAAATGTKLTGLRDDSGGLLTLSSNGKYLLVPGYDIDPGGTFPGPRTIAQVDFNAFVINTTTDPNPAIFTMKSAASDDGINSWNTSGSSIEYTTTGSSSRLALGNLASSNAVGIFGGQLYASSNSNTLPLVTIGNGLPTTAGQTVTAVPGIPIRTRAQQFAFADIDPAVPGMDVLYLASQNPLSPGGIHKYSLINGNWAFNGQVGTTAEHYSGLAITVSGTTVTLFATRSGANAVSGGGELVTLTDNSGYNATLSGTPTVIAFVATPETKSFRGVAKVPLGCQSVQTLQIINITSSQATASWTGDAGSYDYAITNSSATPLTWQNTSNTSQVFSGLTNNTTYYIHIRSACSGLGVSEWSTQSFLTSCRPPAVPSLQINTAATGITGIKWNAVFGAANYEYLISTSATPPSSGTIVTDTSFSVANLNPVSNYFVHVRSDCGSSAFSAWATKSFTTGCFMPAVQVDMNGKNVKLSWNKVNNAVGYEYAVTSSSADPSSGVLTTDTVHLTSFDKGTGHFFHVRTVCSGGVYSPWSLSHFSIQGLSAYPNPVYGTLTISLYGNSSNASGITINDMYGRLVTKLILTGGSATVNTAAWGSGIYIIRYDDGINKYSVKVVKQ